MITRILGFRCGLNKGLNKMSGISNSPSFTFAFGSDDFLLRIWWQDGSQKFWLNIL